MNLAATIAKMKAAGLSSDAIVTALECIVLDETERNGVTRNSVTDVTPAALRMRRMRERKANETNVLDAEKAASVAVSERNSVASQGVTSDNNISSLGSEVVEEKKETIVRNVTRKRNSYAEDFERFWSAFPTDAGMSKLEASKVWDKLPADDRLAAFNCIPAFKAWIAKQGQTYRTVHACRYLSQRRFEGFKEQEIRIREVVKSTRVYVQSGTDAMDAWDAFFKRTKGKMAPRDQRGGWYFETEYPPQEQAA